LVRSVRPEARFEVPLANARVRGRIDLLLRAEDGGPGEVELVDLKTSENRPPSELHKNQLRMYAAAATKLGMEPTKLWIHDLDADDGQRIEVSNDEKEREAFREDLEEWVEGIQRGSFDPVEDRRVCRSRDFRRFCRYAPAEARIG